MPAPPSSTRVEGADVAFALLVAAAAAAAYLSTLQLRPYSDGASLLSLVQYASVRPDWIHPLYVWIGYGLRELLPEARVLDLLRGVSVASAGLVAGASFLLARASGARRAGSVLVVALAATAPAVWFFATTVELHALHAACVAVAACVIVFSPWRRPRLATLLSAPPLLLVFPSHQSGLLLGPGFVMLARWASARQGEVLTWRASLLGVAPAFAVALVAGATWVEATRGHFALGLDGGAAHVAKAIVGPHWRMATGGGY